MLAVESGPFGQRFRLLETMRQFAAEHLAAAGHTDLIAERHARYCLEQVTHLHRLLTGLAEVEAVDRRFARALVRPVVAEVALRSRHEIGNWVERILAMTPPDDKESIVFGLTWAAQQYKLSQDTSGYQRLVARYGEPDHPLIHHARAAVYEDYAALGKYAPAALAELRRRGDHDLAEQTFHEAVGVTVPVRTHSPNKPIEARTRFQRGNRSLAFQLLHSHIDELLDTDNLHGVCVAAVEFVNMMANADRLPDGARILRYVETTGMLDNPVWQAQVARARRTVATRYQDTANREPAHEPDLDDRAALEYMRRVLHKLT